MTDTELVSALADDFFHTSAGNAAIRFNVDVEGDDSSFAAGVEDGGDDHAGTNGDEDFVSDKDAGGCDDAKG